MYIRMSKYCDRVVILKAVSQAVEAFDIDGNVIKGLRKSTTVQIASFNLEEPIEHPEIPDERSLEFYDWRETQKLRIEMAFIKQTAAGKLGGVPLLKTKSDMGNPCYKVGEFSGIISTLITVQPGMIKNVMNGRKSAPDLQQEGSENLADKVTSDALCARIKTVCEDILRYMSVTNRKGTEIWSLQQTLDMRAAWTALGCSLDSRGIGYPKVTGTLEGRNAAVEGLEIFSEMKKHIFC